MSDGCLEAAAAFSIGKAFGESSCGGAACCLALLISGGFFISGISDGYKHKQAEQERRQVESKEKKTSRIFIPGRDLQAQQVLIEWIKIYQKNISPEILKRLEQERICRYEPSCSEYARQAIIKYGATRGSILATGRLLKCNPWSKGGYDPVA
ncbi:MAG: membrane protein insertion efficiency factor YidD [Nanoarchaeota archaeon]|nr:membrane protein insertion efficiency factor YidD [Nanoarchaeota archaeon]